jgi:uncharacterized repeat protein (TIGR01451 family)
MDVCAVARSIFDNLRRGARVAGPGRASPANASSAAPCVSSSYLDDAWSTRPSSAWSSRLSSLAAIALAALCVQASPAHAQSAFGAIKSFTPASINSGATSALTIDITNLFRATDFTNLSFSDTFPAGMTVAPGTVTTQCGGTLTLSAGGFSFAGGTIAAQTTCTVTVNVKGVSTVDVTLVNTTSSFNYDAGGRSQADPGVSGSLFVRGGTPPAITSAVPPPGTVGVAYLHPITVTGTAPITVSVAGLPPGLLFDPATNRIAGTPTVSGSFPGSISASNGFLPDAVQSYTLVIDPALAIKTASPLPNATVGIAYAQTFVASGGNGSYTWQLIGGALPPNLTLSSAGVLSGTPTAFGTFNFTVQVTDGRGVSASKPFQLTVDPAALAITTTSPLAGGTVGAAYAASFAASGGIPPYTWSIAAGAPPPGTTLSTAGVLSGTPTVHGTFNFTVQVSDSRGVTATKPFAVTIVPAPIVITTPSLPAGVQHAPYHASLAASGGVPPYTWSVAGGTLPPGLTLGADGSLSGAPATLGDFTFDVRVSDTLAATSTRTFTITVGPPALTIVTGTPLAPPQNVGTPFALTFAAAGGVAPYAWSVAGGTLPPGLALQSNGLLSGVPTSVGSFAFTIEVIDALNVTATRSYSLDVVVAPLVIVTPAPLAPPIGVSGPFSVVLQADGGLPPYTWSLSSGALPPGLTLGADGRIAGTPTAAGSYTFDARVADSLGHATSRTYTLVVESVASAISVAIAPNPAVLGMPVTVTVQVGGGVVVATGAIEVWIAGSGTRCPASFDAGNPADAVAPVRSAPLDAKGRAQIAVSGLHIDDYRVCVRYAGDGLYAASTAGAFAFSVIKGVVVAPRNPGDAGLAMVAEYYNAALDHWFVTVAPDEMMLLDSGRIAGWHRTGYAFWGYDAPPKSGAALPVCRFYLPPAVGDSHFLSASPAECDAVADAMRRQPLYQGYVYETRSAFWMPLPDPVSGACPGDSQPVYRLWNGRRDSNHRYTVDASVRAAMIALGYVSEGYGPDGVAMCAP